MLLHLHKSPLRLRPLTPQQRQSPLRLLLLTLRLPGSRCSRFRCFLLLDCFVGPGRGLGPRSSSNSPLLPLMLQFCVGDLARFLVAPVQVKVGPLGIVGLAEKVNLACTCPSTAPHSSLGFCSLSSLSSRSLRTI